MTVIKIIKIINPITKIQDSGRANIYYVLGFYSSGSDIEIGGMLESFHIDFVIEDTWYDGSDFSVTGNIYRKALSE